MYQPWALHVMIYTDCHLDRIWNHSEGETSLNVGGIILCCRILDCTERVKLTKHKSSSAFASWVWMPCEQLSPTAMPPQFGEPYPQTVTQSRSFPPQVAFVRVFYYSSGKVSKTLWHHHFSEEGIFHHGFIIHFFLIKLQSSSKILFMINKSYMSYILSQFLFKKTQRNNDLPIKTSCFQNLKAISVWF